MENTHVFMWALGIFNTVLMAVFSAFWRHSGDVHKELFTKYNFLHETLVNYRISVAKEYVSIEAFRNGLERMERLNSQWFEEIDKKFDTFSQQLYEMREKMNS